MSNRSENVRQPPVTIADAGMPAPADGDSLTLSPAAQVLLQEGSSIE